MKPFQDLTWFQSIGAAIDLRDFMQRETAALLERVFECSDISARNGEEKWCISRMSHESLACLDNRGSVCEREKGTRWSGIQKDRYMGCHVLQVLLKKATFRENGASVVRRLLQCTLGEIAITL
ncbi:hypothetical protein AALO_G00013930, partial [Alosa alosa]